MESYLSDIGPKIIALSSDQTIKAVISELNTVARPQHRLISLVGTIARDGASEPYDAALQAAKKIGSKCFLLLLRCLRILRRSEGNGVVTAFIRWWKNFRTKPM